MTIFDDIERTLEGGTQYGWADFEYLNLSNRPEAARVREFLCNCLEHYPVEHRNELIKRMRASDIQFASATFELILHEMFVRLGWSVTVHPEILDGNGRLPDFLVCSTDGESFYVEAALARQYSQQELAAEKRKNQILKVIDNFPSPNFLLQIDPDGSPRSNVPGKKLRHALRTWLNKLDVNSVEAEYLAGKALPQMIFEHDGWHITFGAIPRRADRRDGGRRTIGILGFGVRSIDIRDSIKSVAKFKNGRYGELDFPLVVAINIEQHAVDVSQERDALFGQLQLWIARNEGVGAVQEYARLPDGVWNGPDGPQCTRLSGVWLFRSLDAWHFAARGSNMLYENPRPAHKLPSASRIFTHAVVEDGKLVERPGVSLNELFGLTKEWPEE
ncbi:hypothetical protein [Collimonas pratensis]|uniref:Uncharacterized protein n=1 Tax=Collimonas pratensis TaxID=279113 RepID=A0A127Q163_9BURK|nr:hypothetical protein [Collimonas pratensis]AMP03757.1 hypothetical protein CPter91_1376 [Collimonas pratensis]